MTAGRPTVTWQVGLTAALAVVLALAGAVTALVRSSDNSTTSSLRQLAASTTTVTATPLPTTSSIPPFVAADAGFSAVFPTTPKRQQQPIDSTGVSLQAIIYVALTSGEVVGAGGATVPVTPTGDALQSGLDRAVNGTAQNLKGTVASRTMTSYLGVPAEDAVITTQSTGVVHERVLFRERKIFVLLGIAPKEESPRPSYEELLATFTPL